MNANVGDTVRINTPGESHHGRTGTVIRELNFDRLLVDLGDVQWRYSDSELEVQP